jgi:electron transport complex protein RnfG
MSTADAPLAPPVSAVRMIAALGTVAFLSGVLVVSAYQLALPRIQDNKRVALERALAKVYPATAQRRSYLVTAEHLVASTDPSPAGPVAHALYDRDGRLLGVAAEGAARGYHDTIRVLYAYSPDCQCITAINILRNNDTPGIGDKVMKDRHFLENFKALDVRLTDDGRALAHPIETVKRGTKTSPWQIDAISGATITSRAVGHAINDSAQIVVPRIAAELDVLQRPPEKSE